MTATEPSRVDLEMELEGRATGDGDAYTATLRQLPATFDVLRATGDGELTPMPNVPTWDEIEWQTDRIEMSEHLPFKFRITKRFATPAEQAEWLTEIGLEQSVARRDPYFEIGDA